MKWLFFLVISLNAFARCPSFNQMAARLEGIQDGTPVSVKTFDGESIDGVVEQVLYDNVQHKPYVVFMGKDGHRFTKWMTDLNPTTFNAPIDNVVADSIIRFKSKSGNIYEGRILDRKVINGEDTFLLENSHGVSSRIRVARVNENSLQVIDRPLTNLKLEGNAFRQSTEVTPGDFVSVELGNGRYPARVKEIRAGSAGESVNVEVLGIDGSLAQMKIKGDQLGTLRLSQSSRQQFASKFPEISPRAPPKPPERVAPPVVSSPKKPAGPIPEGLPKVVNPGNGGTEALERIHQLGLYPTEEVIVNGGKIKLGPLFELGDSGRVGAYMLVNINGKETLRFAYRSSSQGTFRILPARNDFNSPFVPGYDKGIGEFALEVPIDVQKQLSAQLTRGPPKRVVDNADTLLAGSVEYNRDLQSWMAYADRPTYIGKQVTSQQVAPKLKDIIKSGNPNSVTISGSAAPDFNPSSMVTSYKTKSAVAGDIDVMVFPSKDGSINYSIMMDSEGKVWIGNATSNQSITSFGVSEKGIDLGAAGMPRWEYSRQIPSGHVGKANPSNARYSDAWGFIKDTPVIKEFYRAQGMKVPQ